jgi:hypothetical protein
MKYDIVAKKETVIQNEIVFLFLRLCSQENWGGGGAVQEEQRIYTHSKGMTVKKWKQSKM